MSEVKDRYLNITGQGWEELMEARLQFRNLLEEYGLTELTGGWSDALEFLENEITKIADSVARRERFLRLIEQTRATLKWQAEQEARTQGSKPPGDREQIPHPLSAKRYRKFSLNTVAK